MFKKSQCFKSYSKQELGLICAYVNTSIQLANKITTRLLEHTIFLYPCLSATNLSILEKIQFKCLTENQNSVQTARL